MQTPTSCPTLGCGWPLLWCQQSRDQLGKLHLQKMGPCVGEGLSPSAADPVDVSGVTRECEEGA